MEGGGKGSTSVGQCGGGHFLSLGNGVEVEMEMGSAVVGDGGLEMGWGDP